MTTRFLQDIIRQRIEMQRTVDYLTGSGQKALQQASALINSANIIILTGIGASWNAVLSAGALSYLGGRPVYMQEAGELLHASTIPRDAIIVAVSRTGRSIEIIQLLAKVKASGAKIIGVTNSADSPLAQESEVAIVAAAKLDHSISVNAYSTLLIAVSALLNQAVNASFSSIADSLQKAIAESAHRLESWQEQLEESSWLASAAPYYFLARSTSMGSCHEARLLWEEGVKMPATAMSTNGFRHGPQEIVREGMRFCLWIDQAEMRDADLAVARDLRELSASVMLIGENLPEDAGDLVCQLPPSPPHWQFVIDILPAQLAAERLSRMSGVDCDSFRICSYIVEDEHGLLGKKAEALRDAD